MGQHSDFFKTLQIYKKAKKFLSENMDIYALRNFILNMPDTNVVDYVINHALKLQTKILDDDKASYFLKNKVAYLNFQLEIED